MDCEAIPVPFHFSTGQYVFLFILLVASIIVLQSPFTVYTAAGLILAWVLMTFISLYLVLLIVLFWTVVFLINWFTIDTFISVAVAWLIALWIIHLTLRYRRVRLQRFLSGLIHEIRN
jgi:hypothetical protein